MRLTLAAILSLGIATAAQAQTPLTGTTGPLTSTPPNTNARVHAPRRTLQDRFNAANTTHDGHLTEAQAQSGMPAVARNFAAIDKDHTGYVTLNDIRAYNRAHRAAASR